MAPTAGGESYASPPLDKPLPDKKQKTASLNHAGTGSEPEKEKQKTNGEKLHSAQNDEDNTGNEMHTNAASSQTKVTSATCIPKAAERIKVELPSHRINGEIQFMRDHALIGKFLGFWPTEKALQGWIASKWKPKGQVTLQLGPKGFFTAIFHCIEDKMRIFEGGRYFFNSSGLYLTEWKPRFNPDKEDFSWAPVWIRMYSLPVEYWREETLTDIGNKLGTFIKVATETKTRKYTSYARICVQMHLTKALVDSVSLFHDDFEWTQPLDYEHIPFRCRKCHEHGHLFRDCPLNAQSKASSHDLNKDSDGFTKIPIRRRHTKKNHAASDQAFKMDPQNRFSILTLHDQQGSPNPESLDQPLPPSPSLNRSDPLFTSDPASSTAAPSPSLKNVESESDPGPLFPSKGKTMMNEKQQASDMDLDAALALSLHEIAEEEEHNPPIVMEEDPDDIYLEELDISKLDLSTLETACKQKEYNSIPPWQIDRLEGILTMVQHQKSLGIQGGS